MLCDIIILGDIKTKVRNSKNRLTPLLLGILIGLIWILAFVVIYKVIRNTTLKNIKKLKLDDDLVQEMYMDITDDDILLYTTGKYTTSNLPVNYIFKRATKYMDIEDIEFDNDTFKISYDSLDSAIKSAYGPKFEYDLSKINGSIESYLMIDGYTLSIKSIFFLLGTQETISRITPALPEQIAEEIGPAPLRI